MHPNEDIEELVQRSRILNQNITSSIPTMHADHSDSCAGHVAHTDSGYCSVAIKSGTKDTGSSFKNIGANEGLHSRHMTAGELRSRLEDAADLLDTSYTIYSAASTLDGSNREAYISEFVNDLFVKTFPIEQVEEKTRTAVLKRLPELLKAFALSLGYLGQTKAHRDVMVFIHKQRKLVFPLLHLNVLFIIASRSVNLLAQMHYRFVRKQS